MKFSILKLTPLPFRTRSESGEGADANGEVDLSSDAQRVFFTAFARLPSQ